MLSMWLRQTITENDTMNFIRLTRWFTLLLLGFAAVNINAASDTEDTSYEKAIFAGGCFWCMEPPYDKLDGVISTTSGYTAGQRLRRYHIADYSADATAERSTIQRTVLSGQQR